MSKDRSSQNADGRNPALKTYLDALKEAKSEGLDPHAAADAAEKVTLSKHGRLPKEGR